MIEKSVDQSRHRAAKPEERHQLETKVRRVAVRVIESPASASACRGSTRCGWRTWGGNGIGRAAPRSAGV